MNLICRARALIDEAWQTSATWEVNYANARTMLKEALGGEPNNPQLLTCLGTVLSDLGHYRQAADLLQRAVDIGIKDRNAYFNLAVAHLNLGHREKAMDLFKQAEAMNPDSNTWAAYFDPHGH